MGFFDRLKREYRTIRDVARALRMTVPIARNPARTFPDVIADLAERYGAREALVSARERFTYRELDDRANRYARWALAEGLQKGDVVCLLMPNRPEYLGIWVGLTRVGVVAALLNTHLAGATLAHCISIVKPKHLIVAAELLANLRSAEAQLAVRPKVWLHGEADADLPRIDTALAAVDARPLDPDERPKVTIDDHALFIYTSGTTGLPKAANVNHYRIMAISHGFAGVMGTRADDRMYVCLPMYHSAGGVLATGATLLAGGSVVIRERFSAREFWDDIVRYDCTVFQYIGELCRYLVTTPPSPAESRHRIRLCCGNGLRPDIWQTFQQRFRIPRIIEFYGATEGNVVLFNLDGTPGAVGRIPWYMAHRFPTAIVRFDIEREEPVRGSDGFCIPCKPNEVGELISRVLSDPKKPANRFEGYADAESTKRKILRDVFERGDAWFRTGDLMRKDERGYYYFIDRIGDTFRWKGENVSTTEVAEAITVFPGVTEATVYGVKVEGYDGRAGMAAVVAEHRLDLEALREHLSRSLPDYARPIFIRIRTALDVTGTFKQRKVELVREGFDPSASKDAIYFNDPAKRSFVRVDSALYERIIAGTVRL